MKLAAFECHPTATQPDLSSVPGTSQGVPMIRCDCAVCCSSDPADNRTRASIFLETPEGNYVGRYWD
jgi:hypothetical protein